MVASVATFAALLSHVVAGGDVPGWVGAFAPWMIAVAVSTLLAGRGLSRVRLGASVVVSQLLFHVLFVLGTPTPRVAASGSLMHRHHGGAPLSLGDSLGDGDAAASALCADPAMWTGHGIAAAITILFLCQAERAARGLLALCERVRRWVRRLVSRGALPLPLEPARSFSTPSTRRVAQSIACSLVHPRRGPPQPIAL